MTSRYVLPALYSGVTTIRSVGGVEDFDSRLRDDIAAGKKKGPRILAGNMAVSVPNGHMAGSLAYIAHSAEEAVEFVRKIAEDGPDLIKLMITGGVYDATVKGEPGVLRMPAEYVKAACDEAHKLGFHVAAHAESPEGIKIALRNGVDTIEHGAKPDDEMMALFKETGSALVATLSPAPPTMCVPTPPTAWALPTGKSLASPPMLRLLAADIRSPTTTGTFTIPFR